MEVVHSKKECVSYLCASHVYINGKGEIKPGYVASVVELFEDACNMSWHYLKTSQSWELEPAGLLEYWSTNQYMAVRR
ncbi:hypothetical protein C2S52_023254 [Perilla frutescens var. hirtella]|nr:hypothetical protein C2S52_023254 [Perilla frutescens var. hirtella]